MLWTFSFSVLLLLFWSAATNVSVQAQAPEGTIHGSIADASGTPLPDVAVVVKRNATAVKQTTTDQYGKFEIRSLQPGTYLLMVEKSGFKPDQQSIVVPTGPFNIVLSKAQSNLAASNNTVQFSDEPEFAVAGVKDWTAAGGHGSDANIKTTEALAKDTSEMVHASSEAVVSSPPKLGTDELVRRRDELRKQLAAHETAALHREIADIDESLNDPVTAEHEYERAVQLDPSEQNYFGLGAELLLHHAIQPSAQVFQKGTTAFPKSERMMAGYGAALYASGLYDSAAERLCAASDLNPSDARPYLFLGKMLQAAPRTYPCAEEKLSRFAHDQPDNANANYFYALALWKSGDRHPMAVTAQVDLLLQKAVKIDPKLAAAFLHLAILYSSQGKNDLAISACEKAIAAQPDFADPHLQLAQLYKKRGETDKAREEFQQYQTATKKEAAALDQQRRESQQFVIVFKGQGQP